MANVGRDNMINEEQESSQSNSSNGSGAALQQQSSGGFQLKSSILRQPATFGSGAGAGGGFGGIFGGSSSGGSSAPINSFNLKPSVLKPSHFGGGFGAFGERKNDDQSQTKGNSFGANPFLKTQVSEEDGPEANAEDDKSDKEENVDPLAKLNRASLPKSNLFANVKAITQNTGFVFGQNVHERVTGDNLQSDSSSMPTAGLSFSSTAVTNNSTESKSSNSCAAGGQASAVDTAGSGTTVAGSSGASKEGGDESLEEAARRYEESRGALKRKFDEVETVTGEEDERNVVEANCKLFAFAKSNWEERGHGTLRLNDKDNKESRVVFRQAGNLRVLINTKVWSGMTAEQSSPKSLRLTAMDNNGQVKVFLVMTRPEVIGKLHKELFKRIQVAKENAEDALLRDDEAGKENNNDNAATTATTKPSDCEDDSTAADSASKEPDSDGHCAKKRLNSSS
ncbi:ran-binding protein 3 [Armigeres subalbatus]|uniref:ran-binding protein 3 n=1 Tax=Armigeres subalbatus TaxID=124917 RepID=UPI002ED6304B